MRHAGPEALGRLDDVLVALRSMPQLRERTVGSFSRGGRAFCHFHEDAERLFVDARIDPAGGFDRHEVTTRAQRRAFLAAVRAALGPHGGRAALSER